MRSLLISISIADMQWHGTDIKPDNIMFSVPDDDLIFQELEQEELRNPSPGKELDGRTIYISSQLGRPTEFGPPVPCDFGSAVLGNIGHTEDIQPNIYRAPEVILEAPWGYSVDIWNVGCMVSTSLPPSIYPSIARVAIITSI
jgi:serine/threonine-protein kinase SRPK3